MLRQTVSPARAVVPFSTKLRCCSWLGRWFQAYATVSDTLPQDPPVPHHTTPRPAVHANGIIHRDIKPDNTLLVHNLLPMPPPAASNRAAPPRPPPRPPSRSTTSSPPSAPVSTSPTLPPSLSSSTDAAGGAPPPLPAGASSALLPHMAATWRDDAAWDVPHAASLQDMAQEHAQHIPMLRTLLGDAAVDSVTGTCVRLADLGVSHMFQEDAPDDMIKATAGTPAFHAPEMFTGGAFSGCKADIWALGCTLFAMLAGRMPVDGISSRSRQDHLGKALQDNDVRMDLVENCSGSCSDFLRQALCKDPAQRQDAKALAKHPWLTLHGILPPADEIMHDAEDKLLREPALSALASGGAPASSGPAMAAAARISADMQQLREAALSLQQQAMELMQSLGAARVGAVRALGPLQGVAPHIPLGLLGAREPVEHRMAPAATQSHMLQQETRSPRAAGCALGYAPAVTEAEVRGALTPVMSFHKLARLKLKAANAARRLSRIYAQRMAGKVVAANRVVRGFASGANAPPLDAAESSNES